MGKILSINISECQSLGQWLSESLIGPRVNSILGPRNTTDLDLRSRELLTRNRSAHPSRLKIRMHAK